MRLGKVAINLSYVVDLDDAEIAPIRDPVAEHDRPRRQRRRAFEL